MYGADDRGLKRNKKMKQLIFCLFAFTLVACEQPDGKSAATGSEPSSPAAPNLQPALPAVDVADMVGTYSAYTVSGFEYFCVNPGPERVCDHYTPPPECAGITLFNSITVLGDGTVDVFGAVQPLSYDGDKFTLTNSGYEFEIKKQSPDDAETLFIVTFGGVAGCMQVFAKGVQ